jgi:hypothetical protein
LREAEEAKATLACRQDLDCWAKRHWGKASPSCYGAVESLAKIDAQWQSGVKFPNHRWANEAQGTVTYTGDRIKFQNGFGAYIPHVYECDYDPDTESVVDVRATPGRR